jgi:hypothetical protein
VSAGFSKSFAGIANPSSAFTYPTAKWSLTALAKVMLLGDSITDAGGGVVWTTAIQAAAAAHYGVNAPTWYNYGVSGQETAGVDTDLNSNLAAVPNPTHVIVRSGVNDRIHGTAIEASVAHISSFCAKLRASSVAPGNVMIVDNLVWGERPIDGANTAKGGDDAGIVTINRVLQYFAQQNGFIFAETRDKFWRPWEIANNVTAPPAGHGLFTASDDGYPGQLGVHPTNPAGRDLLGNWILANYIQFS